MLVGKAAPIKAQLAARKEKGVNCIEFHLPTLDFDVDSYISIIESSGVQVIHVHTPLENDVSLSDIADYKYQGAILGSCEIAQYFAEKQESEVGVVIHTPTDITQPVNVDLIRKILGMMSKMFPNVYFLIENIPSVGLYDNKEIRTRGYDLDNVDLCKAIDMPNKVFTLLDTCHIYMTLQEQVEGTKLQSVTEYIKGNKDYLRGMHIADCAERGLTEVTHGTPLLDKNKLSELVNALQECDLDIPLVIETREIDYLNPSNLVLGWNALQEMGNFAGFSLPCA